MLVLKLNSYFFLAINSLPLKNDWQSARRAVFNARHDRWAWLIKKALSIRQSYVKSQERMGPSLPLEAVW